MAHIPPAGLHPLTRVDVFRKNAGTVALPRGSSQGAGPARLAPGTRGVLVLTAVFGVIGLAIGWASCRKVILDERFIREGRETTAAVLGSSVESGRGGPWHHFRYEFQVDAKTYQGRADIADSPAARRAQETGQIPIRYLSAAPEINRWRKETDLPVALALAFPLLLIAPLALAVWELIRDRALLAHGQMTAGLVIATTGARGRRDSVRVFYDFIDARGEVRRGTSSVRQPLPEGINVGAFVPVVFLPQNPARSALYASLSWRL